MIEKPAIIERLPGLYSLVRDWTFATKVMLPAIDDEAFEVSPSAWVSAVTVYAYDSTLEHPHCDGVSCFPNRIFGVSLLEAAMFHDRWYERLEAIALGWPVRKVRKAGDKIFRELVIETNKGRRMAVPVAWVAYIFVRLFGGIYHEAHKRGLGQ